jgi:FtsP/CotA-like multicopper oxidase with cupredoxin domain
MKTLLLALSMLGQSGDVAGNVSTGEPFGQQENYWMAAGDHTIGHKVKKARYIEYTDETFTTVKRRDPEWEHLGILGPLLRAEVGDTFRIVFKNNVSFPASLHPHGVFYDKDSEGAPYDDGTSGADKADDAVPPGGTHTYVWPVPERAGPAEGDRSSVFWMYHSHANEVKDVNSGLTGPMIIYADGATDDNGDPIDVDREFVIAFQEFDENESWYLRENLDALAGKPDEIQIMRIFFGGTSVGPPPDVDFQRYFRETMNGYSYSNLPMPTMKVGERVRWYVMASTNFEMHTPHWHGNTVIARGMRTDMMSLLPMDMLVADMVPDNPGKWFFHCHVSFHLAAGMQSMYIVELE